MVKRSKNSKSKRVTLKHKHKVLRKVKLHHKKKAKDANKLGLHRKPKVEKDPCILNDWPSKEQELKALEARGSRALEEIEQKKEARKERAKKRNLGLVGDEDTYTEDQRDDAPKIFNVQESDDLETLESLFHPRIYDLVDSFYK